MTYPIVKMNVIGNRNETIMLQNGCNTFRLSVWSFCASLNGPPANMPPCMQSQLELKLGIGGTSYADFIRSLNLPIQLRFVKFS